jgi:Domain of unknown function (DUF5134)
MLEPLLNIPASLILGAGTVFCLTRASRGGAWVDRVNYVIHALMAVGMLAMIWHHGNLPVLPQVLLFSLGSFWFVLQAVSRPEFTLSRHTRSGKLICLYHAAMLASMVLMLTLPHSSTVLQEQSIIPSEPRGHASHVDHGKVTVDHAPLMLEVDVLWVQPASQVLSVVFAAAVLAWLLPLDRVKAQRRVGKTLPAGQPSGHRHRLLERTNDAGAALVMSLMFATVSFQS